MARTLEEIQRELNAATLATSQAYDKLKNLRSAGTKFIEKNKGTFDAAQKAYKEAQTRKNELDKELKAAEKESESEQTKKSLNNQYKKTLDELKAAEFNLTGYKGDTGYQSAYQKAEAAYNAVVAAGGLPDSPLPEQKIPVQPVGPGANAGAQGGTGSTGATGGTGALETSGAILNAALSSDAALTDLQSNLKKNFPTIYKGAVDGKKSWAETQVAVDTILQSRGRLPEALRGADFAAFIKDPNSVDLIVAGGGAGSGVGKPTLTISNPTDAASTINYAIKNLLQRDATTKEVADLTKILNDAERKNPSRTVNGQTTGGINRLQFLTDVIKTGEYKDKKLGKLPTLAALAQEVLSKKTDKAAVTKETLMSTIASNGVQVPQEQIDLWAKEVDNGKNIDNIKQQIRNIASAGMPDNVKKMLAEGTDLATIYSPYKTQMAAILEINPNDIRLTDPSLTAAIGPNGEMPIYEYQRALRKDPRWQYTNNARDTVANGLTTVLKDFGFMG